MKRYTPIHIEDRTYYVDLTYFDSQEKWMALYERAISGQEVSELLKDSIFPISTPYDPTNSKKRTRMAKPDINEACRFFQDNRSSTEEAERFFDFYEANGWKVGRNPMKDWKAAARNWIRNAKNQTYQRTGSAYGLQSNPSGASSNDRAERRDLDSLV